MAGCRSLIATLLLTALITVGTADAKSQQTGSASGMESTQSASAGMLLRQSSGTDTQPTSLQMPQHMQTEGEWQWMWMGQAFLTDVQQTGPPAGRSTPQATGLDKLYSTNWGMLAAAHSLGPGAWMLRSMLSLEPATISDRRFPELFQTGETAYGVPIVDGQHPHNFVMELAAEVAEPLSQKAVGYVYYAPVGDPALGPPAYPHRASAAELPQAPLGHHYEDSSHIAYNVATVGVEDRWLRLEASGFLGREPDENRWTVHFGGMDSWSIRAAASPWRSVTAQISTGRLSHPEQASPVDIERTTASAEYVRPMSHQNWASTVIWGRNYKTVSRYAVNAITAETVIPASVNNLFTGRYEWSQRDELFDADSAVKQAFLAQGTRWFDISAVTGGYTRVVGTWHGAEIGVGANATTYVVPNDIKPYYGQRPFGASIYLRARLKNNSPMRGMQKMPGMSMDCC